MSAVVLRAWQRVALPIVVLAAVASIGLDTTFASAARRREIEWSQTGVGAVITRADGSTIVVAAVENSVDGPGAVVAEVTINGSNVTQSAKRYSANGIFVGEEQLTLGTPAGDGTIPFTGTGECVKGGTGVHKKEKCRYTVTGALDPTTNNSTFEVRGTSTRRPEATRGGSAMVVSYPLCERCAR